MAKTYNVQFSPPPDSGNKGTIDGSPLHSIFGIDAMLGVNNLAYTMPFAGFVHAHNTYDGFPGDATNFLGLPYAQFPADTVHNEYFAGQVPTVLPASMFRFCWTLGVYLSNVTDAPPAPTFTLDDVTVYIAPEAYSGDIIGVFDNTKMGGPYGTSRESTAVTAINAADTEYHLIDNSAGDTSSAGPLIPFTSRTTGGLAACHLIVTLKGHCASSGSFTPLATVADFTWWVKPE